MKNNNIKKSSSMFGGTGGYFWMDSWILANIVQLGTQNFCRRFLNRRNDPCGRTYDQMTQSARSGCANNAEGSARRATSKETEMRVEARAKQEDAPTCPDCENPMIKRQAKSGRNAGKKFWGCTKYPECKGLRKIEE